MRLSTSLYTFYKKICNISPDNYHSFINNDKVILSVFKSGI